MCVYLLTIFLLHYILALHILLLSEGVNLSTPTALPTKGRSNKSDLWFLRWVQKTMQYKIVEAPLKIKLHPWSLTWNLKISSWKRRFLLETIISRFHVKLWGCFSVLLYTCQFCLLWPFFLLENVKSDTRKNTQVILYVTSSYKGSKWSLWINCYMCFCFYCCFVWFVCCFVCFFVHDLYQFWNMF